MNQTLIDALSGIADAIRAKDTSLVGTTMNAWEMPSKIANIPTGGGGQVDKYGVTLNGILGNVDTGGNLLRAGEHFSLSSSAITSIPSYYFQRSFYGKNIDKVDLPNLVSIGNWAFESAAPSSPSLSSVSMPSLESVSQYGLQYAFRNCPSMKSIDLDSVQGIQQYGMQGCCYNDPQLSSFNMPSLENVGAYGMLRCLSGDSSLEEVCLTSLSSVENYGMYECFKDCTSLEEVCLSSLTTIGSSGMTECFKDCTSLRRVEMPLSQAGTGSLDSTFNGCSSLEEVDFRGAVAIPQLSNIDCFANTNDTFVIYVPPELSALWMKQGNWANPEVAKHIYGYVPEFSGLTLTATQDGSTVSLSRFGNAPSINMNYSLDNGQTWSAYTIGDTITLDQGESVSFWTATGNTALATGSNDYHNFVMTGEWMASGDLNSLLFLDYSNPSTYAERAFYKLFQNCTSLTDVQGLELRADYVPLGTYGFLFYGTSITKGPQIYASSAAGFGFTRMFFNCYNLNEIKLINWTGSIPNSNTGPFQFWVQGVQTSSGTFYYNGSDASYGDSAVPNNWTIQSF